MLLPPPASPDRAAPPELRATRAPSHDAAAVRAPHDAARSPGDADGDPVLCRALAVARAQLGATTALHLGAEPVPAGAAHVVVPVVDPGHGERLASLVVPREHVDDGARLLASLIADRLASRARRDRQQRERRQQVGELLAPGGLSTAFQPIVSLDDGGLVGVEALVRAGGDVDGDPTEWLRAASAVGMRAQLERLAVARAVEVLDELPATAFLAVNLSAPVLASGWVTPLLATAPLERVVVELTEHDAVGDYDALNRELAPLRHRGMRLAIDDVGAGFASMRHVLRTRPEILKLDRAFVADLVDDAAASEALIASLCDFARAIGATVVAEGVERAEEEAAVRDLGVSWAQGHRYGRPAGTAGGTRLVS